MRPERLRRNNALLTSVDLARSALRKPANASFKREIGPLPCAAADGATAPGAGLGFDAPFAGSSKDGERPTRRCFAMAMRKS